MTGAGWAWVRRRDPELLAVRRAGRVTIVASSVLYVFDYVLGNQTMAMYGLFSAVAMGFLAQLPGPPRRQAATVLRALPVALVLVTVGTLVAGNVWLATLGVLIVGFVIAFMAAAGPSVAGSAPGLQLFFILACFPPYAPRTLDSRLIGVVAGIVLLALAEPTLWPARGRVTHAKLLAAASERLADNLWARVTGRPVPPDEPGWPVDAVWPPALGLTDRPTSASRRDRALKDAGRALSFALARLRDLPVGAPPVPPLSIAADAARAVAVSLRGGPPPPADELGKAIAAVRSAPRRPAEDPGVAAVSAVAVAVWSMAIAVRVAMGAPIQYGARPPRVRPDRFPYACRGPVRLWWQRLAVHRTTASVYLQGAVRVAVALAAARLLAGSLELSHGFWVLLATLTLLRGRAATTGLTLGPAAIGTAVGAAVVWLLLLLVGPRTEVYAALTPPVMVLAFVAGALFGLAWGQALFTVLITLAFAQLGPAGAQLAEVRVLDVILGALIGVTAGVLAWPRGAVGALHRSAARLVSATGELTCDAAAMLTGRGSDSGSAMGPPETWPAMARLGEATELTEAAYATFEAEQRPADEPATNWPAVLSVGEHAARGAEVLVDTRDQAVAAPQRAVVDDWAKEVGGACVTVAAALRRRRELPSLSTVVGSAPDATVADIQLWLATVARDLARIRSRDSGRR